MCVCQDKKAALTGADGKIRFGSQEVNYSSRGEPKCVRLTFTSSVCKGVSECVCVYVCVCVVAFEYVCAPGEGTLYLFR